MRVYEIAARVSLTGNALEGLAALAAASGRVERHFKAMLQHIRDFDRQGRAIIGGFAIFTADKLGHALVGLGDHAKELSRQITQLKALGAKPEDFQKMYAAAMALPTRVPGVRSDQAFQIESQMFSMFYNDKAGAANITNLLEPLAKFQVVMAHMTGDSEKANKTILELVRSGELLGKFINEQTGLVDVEKAKKWMNFVTNIMEATHGVVGPHAFYQMAQQGGPAMSAMTDEGLAVMAILAQSMGGPRAGTAIMSIFQQLKGGKMWKNVAKELTSLGPNIIGDNYTTGKGGNIIWGEGALDTPFTRAMAKDPREAFKILQQAMVEKGLTTPDQQVTELFKIFQRATSQREMHDILRNFMQMGQEVQTMFKGTPYEEFFKTIMKESVPQAFENISQAWNDMLAKMALPGAQAAIPMLNSMGRFFEQIGQAATQHPDAFANLGKGLAILTAALAAGGMTLLLSALGPAGWLVAALTALAGVALWHSGADIDNIIRRLKDLGKAVYNLEATAGKKGWRAALLELNDKLGASYERQNKRMIDLIATYVTWDNALKLNDLVWRGAISVFEGMAKKFGEVVEWIDSKWNQMMESISGAITRLWNYLKSLMPFGGATPGSYGGGGLGGGIIPASYGGGGGVGAGGPGADPRNMAAYIREQAALNGIDPAVALRVARSEGLGTFLGDSGRSGGAFQLYTGGGLGNIFQRETGLNPLDPKNEKATIAWAMKHVGRTHDWGPWHGAARVGIGRHAGFGYSGGTGDDQRIPGNAHLRRPRQSHHTIQETNINLDGRVIARHVTRHQVAAATHAHQAPHFDGSRLYSGPDRQVNTG